MVFLTLLFHFIQRDLTFVWQEESRKMSTDNAEKSNNVLQNTPSGPSPLTQEGGTPLITGSSGEHDLVSFPKLL